MDNLDNKILYEISENADESRKKIAKKLRVSREVLDYRIKKLEKEGIIIGYQARVNISNFIYGGYIMLIQSVGITSEKEKTLFSKIKSNKNVQYFGKMGGEYDFIVGFTVKILKELSETIDYINNSFGKNKISFTLLTMTNELKDSFKDLFSNSKNKNSIRSMPETEDKVKLDKIDKIILSRLSKKSNIPSWEIAEKVGISDVSIRKRIKKLIDQKIILGFRTMINLSKINYSNYFVTLKVNSSGDKKNSELKNFLISEKNLTYATRIVGEYDYILTLVEPDNKALNEFLSRLKNNFSDQIIKINLFPLFEMIYHTQLAEGVLN